MSLHITGLTSEQLRMIKTAIQEHKQQELEHRSCNDPDGYLYRLDEIRHAIDDTLGDRAVHKQHYDDYGYKRVRVRDLEQLLKHFPDSEENPFRQQAEAIWYMPISRRATQVARW